MSSIQPLNLIRAVVDDKQLNSTEKAFMVACIRRANNDDGRVKASQELLAEGAACSPRTVYNMLKRPTILRYFDRVKRSQRAVDLWLATVPLESSEPEPRSDSAGRQIPAQSELDASEPEPRSDSAGTTFRPSAFSTSSSASICQQSGDGSVWDLARAAMAEAPRGRARTLCRPSDLGLAGVAFDADE